MAPRQLVYPRAVEDIIATKRTISLWHLDVEGAEVPVLASARRLFEERRVERVMLEFIPFRWPSQNISMGRGGLRLLDSLLRIHVVGGAPWFALHTLHITRSLSISPCRASARTWR